MSWGNRLRSTNGKGKEWKERGSMYSCSLFWQIVIIDYHWDTLKQFNIYVCILFLAFKNQSVSPQCAGAGWQESTYVTCYFDFLASANDTSIWKTLNGLAFVCRNLLRVWKGRWLILRNLNEGAGYTVQQFSDNSALWEKNKGMMTTAVKHFVTTQLLAVKPSDMPKQ